MAQERARSKPSKAEDAEKPAEANKPEPKTSRFAALERRRLGAADPSEPTQPKRRVSLTERLQQRKSEEVQAEPSLQPEAEAESDAQGPKRRPAGPPPRRISTPANDDLPSIGGLIFSLQQKPSRTPFTIALIASAVWFVIGGFLSYGMLSSAAEGATTPTMLTAAMAIIIPIAIFWFLALLVWRAQELRLMASAMAEVAVRLAEPDKLAEQSVASLGQVIRRQVAAMNDGISRAIGRASELEALVHNEVAALERSYGDNEIRVRGLISELASEREALVNNSDRVGNSLKGVGQQVARDIAAASSEIDKTLADRGLKLTELLVARSNEAAQEVYKAQDLIASKMPPLLQELGKEQSGLTKLVEDAVANLTALESAVGERTAHFDSVMQERSASFAMTLAERIQGLEQLVQQGTSMIDSTLQERTNALGAQFDRGTQTLVKTLEDGTEVFAVSADQSITGLETALRSRTDAFTSSINQGAVALDRTLAERSDAVSKSLNDRLQSIDTAFGERAGAVTKTIDERLTAIDQILEQRSTAVTKGLEERMVLMDKAFEARGAAVNKALENNMNAIDQTIAQRGAAVNKTLEDNMQALEQRGAAVNKTLADNMKAIDDTFAQRTEFATKRMDERLIAMDKQIQARATEVAKDLDARLKAIDTTIEQRGGMVTKGLDERLKAIDSTFQRRTGEVDNVLGKHVQGADRLLTQHVRGAEQTFGRQSELLHKVLSENSASLRETAAIVGKQSGQAVDMLTKQTDSLKQVSSGLLDQIHTLTQRFENQGQGILTAAKALETSNTKIDSILESRHQAIIGLLHTVNNKARELDNQMQNYVGVITNSMTEAEQRAKHATELLSRDTSNQARQAVAQIEKLRNDAQQHTAQAVADLKGSFARVIGEIGQQMEQMRGQFDNTSQGMREVARQTAGDLESLRHEMQTRMEALPEHTAQATEAIRRALANQISEIEAITPVLTSAATQGLSRNQETGYQEKPSPQPAQPQRPSRSTQASRPSPAPSFEQPAPLRGETIPPEPPQYDYSPLPEFDSYGRPTGGAPLGDIGSVAGSLAEQMTGASSFGDSSFGATGEPAGKSSQWSGGSRSGAAAGNPNKGGQKAPPPPRGQRPGATNSGGLRLDEISRAIDQRTAADVWARYRAGQQGVLNRQLYTRDGQGTFDEISRRYARDPEFRTTVDRYMSDFERLLGEAEQADPEGRMLDNYLVSETGRVYLLLAHASGRLN